MRSETHITKNFRYDEVWCRGIGCCGNSCPVDLRMMLRAQRLRDLVGIAIIVNSGYRCKVHNANMPNASPKSNHMRGRSLDFRWPAIPKAMFLGYLDTVGFKGIRQYDWGVHIDEPLPEV